MAYLLETEMIFRPTQTTHRAEPSSTRPSGQATGDGKSTTPLLFVLGATLGLAVAAVLFSADVQAQSALPPAAAASTPAQAPAGPKYTTAQIEQAFRLIDANRDGKISREEAAGFRGVARHFDEADVDKDGVLSREEFDNALNGSKSH